MPILQYESGGHIVNFELSRTYGSKLSIGRDDSNDLVFPDREMALHHADVIRASNGLFVLMGRDLSRSVVNNQQVPGIKVLRDGDVIMLGQTAIKYLEIQKISVMPESDLVNVQCPFCQAAFKEGDEVICCPKCDTGYHEACWGLMTNELCSLPHCGYFIEKPKHT